MVDSFLLNQNLPVIAVLMLVLLSLVTGIGYLFGRRHGKQASDIDKHEKTTGTIAGAMLALLGFMLVITLSMADAEFHVRRKLILDEANAISTSSLRARAIGGRHGKEIVQLLHEYARLRLDFFAAGEDPKRLAAVYKQASALQERIWGHASSIAQTAPTPVSALLLTSLNQLFDLETARRWVLEVRVPPYIIKLLLAFSLLAMGVIGYYFGICGVRHPILALLLIAAVTAAILLIMDLDRPRSGYIQTEQSPLFWLVEAMELQTKGTPGE